MLPLGRLGIAVECIPADLQEQSDWSGIAFYWRGCRYRPRLHGPDPVA